MKTQTSFIAGKRDRGSILLVVLAMVAVVTITAASLVSWTGAETVNVSRRASHIDALYGAEAATRRGMAQIRNICKGIFPNNSYYTGSFAAPTASQLSTLTGAQGPASFSTLNNNYTFSNFSLAYLAPSTSATPYVLTTNSLGQSFYTATIRCFTTAISKTQRYSVPAKIGQTFQVQLQPTFQYAVFYNMDMEAFNGPAMTIDGRVHVNGTLYYAPANDLRINSNLTTSEDIERGIKLWDSGKPTAFSSLSSSAQNTYRDSVVPAGTIKPNSSPPVAYTDAERSAVAANKWPVDPDNFVSTDPTSSGYGEASFRVKNASTGNIGTAEDFQTSTSPITYFDSESAGWAGGALTKWGGGVRSKDQSITDLPPPVGDSVLQNSTDPTNPYHVMIEAPVLDSTGASTESTGVQAAKAAYHSSLIIQRSGSSVIYRIRGTDGKFHPVNNLRNSTNIISNAGSGSAYNSDKTTILRDQREYLQNGSVKMSVTELDVGALYGNSSTDTSVGAIGSGGDFMDSKGTATTSDDTAYSVDANGVSFTPVPFDGTLYVYDDNHSSSRKPAIRVRNGATIYDNDKNSTTSNTGISILSENPVYVQGNFNADGTVSTGPEKTGASKENVPPAMIAGDIVSVLSTSWNSADDDPSSTSDYFGRTSAGTTEANAAILAGVNQSSQSVTAGSFDGTTGGLNNFPHFLEQWSGTFKYSGSLVALWYGKQSTSTYRGAGTANNVFSAPTRDWAFNTDFLDPNKLPRLTPVVPVFTATDWSNMKDY